MLVIEAISQQKITAGRVYPLLDTSTPISKIAYRKIFSKEQRLQLFIYMYDRRFKYTPKNEVD